MTTHIGPPADLASNPSYGYKKIHMLVGRDAPIPGDKRGKKTKDACYKVDLDKLRLTARKLTNYEVITIVGR